MLIINNQDHPIQLTGIYNMETRILSLLPDEEVEWETEDMVMVMVENQTMVDVGIPEQPFQDPSVDEVPPSDGLDGE